MSNSAIVDFGAAAARATVKHFGLFSAATSGNLLVSEALAAPQTVSATNPVNLAVGSRTFSVN